MLLLLIMLGISSSKCINGLRDDPLLIMNHNGKKHYVYFLHNEMDFCNKLSKGFDNGKITRICGCKVLKAPRIKHRLRLRCIDKTYNSIYSKTIAIYYYYPDMMSNCIRLRDKLMQLN